METRTCTAAQAFPGDQIPYRTSTMDPNQRFYRHFLDSVAVIQDQMSQLESLAAIGGERQAAIDHVLAEVAKLQNEVADAAEFTPAYDRRQYSEAIKVIQDQLNQTIAKVTPKSRFQFKRSSKTQHVDMGSPENDPRLSPGSLSRNGHNRGPASPVATEEADTVGELPPKGKDYNQEMARPGVSSVRKPSFSTAKNIGISGQKNIHIILPSSAAHATAAGSLTNLTNCVVDMSIPTAEGSPFPGLALKNISSSLIVAGRVNGPVHITGVTDSVLVITAHQVRIHECSNVDIYLHCGSHPIIEDCAGMRFAPLPDTYVTEAERATENQWDQVDDFKWLKAGHSPNWTVLSDSERLRDGVWKELVPGKPGASVEETLKAVGIPRV
ncbi:hypothetical protein S7711_04288 [Stachybotrys chartarum IBT 7711]|uniref:C-CAP/cofactor C-like domain-containing protein n=1 Tax=Stachybotrys chartarum (strain CBS 109288 / IBT 7711) TaxID=1280523 RepID=A0A084AJB2_STACB|nr:hypothetical protein S7711_04288 [Stachybotrys chartarum IBT 7711]